MRHRGLADREYLIVAEDRVICVGSAPSVGQRANRGDRDSEKCFEFCRRFRRRPLQLEISNCLVYGRGGKREGGNGIEHPLMFHHPNSDMDTQVKDRHDSLRESFRAGNYWISY